MGLGFRIQGLGFRRCRGSTVSASTGICGQGLGDTLDRGYLSRD